MRTEGADSSFQLDLRESLHLDSHGMRLDKIRFANTFLTTDLGNHLYYLDGSGGLQYYTVPEQAYTGVQLAAAIQTATGRTTTYDPLTNNIEQAIVVGQEWLSDEALKAFSTGFPVGTSPNSPRSLNTILRTGRLLDTADAVHERNHRDYIMTPVEVLAILDGEAS